MDKLHQQSPDATLPALAPQLPPPSAVSLQVGLTGVVQLGGNVGRLRALRFYADAPSSRYRVYALLERRSPGMDDELATLELVGEGADFLEAGAQLVDQVVAHQGVVRSFLEAGK